MNRLARILMSISFLMIGVQPLYAGTSHQNVVPNQICLTLDGAYVLSQEDPPVYLGFFGNQFAAESIMNQFGTYGSQFSSVSVRNTIGKYGSAVGIYSANNNVTSTPPAIVRNGTLLGYLTTNPVITGGISLPTIDASCTFFASAPVVNTSPPAAPASVQATDGLFTDAIELTWDAVPGATNYLILRAEAREDTPVPIGSTADTVLPVLEGESGKVYWFWVAASNSAGQSPLSEPDSGYIAEGVDTFLLTVQKVGDGYGRVQSSPPGIDCGSTCTTDFTEGVVVTLTASSEDGSTFVGWAGGCTGNGSCILTMDGERTVTAEFEMQVEPPDVNRSSIFMPMLLR